MTITVFTPTYNRAPLLPRLYESLCRQTYRDFEWLIVDDGSTDNTAAVVQGFSTPAFPIRYLQQENGGKHRALNCGAREAQGELFFIVDSDDYLTPDALQQLAFYYDQIKDDPTFCGVCGLKCYPDMTPTGGFLPQDVIDICPLQRKYRGDMAEAFRTELFRANPFPDIPGEKFCSEALAWNRIWHDKKIRYFNKNIYVCEYLEDGLSFNSVRNRRNSPTYATLVYSEMMEYPLPWKRRLKAAINFWRFYFLCPKECRTMRKPFYSWLFLPLGVAMAYNDKRKLKRNA